MSTQLQLNHAAYTYLTVTQAPQFSSPVAFSSAHPALAYVQPVGSLTDVHILSVPKEVWASDEEQILKGLQDTSGVAGVQVVAEPKQRVKRGEEEL